MTERSKSRRLYSLSEKIAIVRETLKPGVTSAYVARRHGIHLNLIYYWRRVYRDVADADFQSETAAAQDEVHLVDLRLQVRSLQRLLGQRTLEVELLRAELEGRKR